ncbi:MAG: restriction endonuclease [Ignavibacteria bacterium]|nr:restriction endonuclease [Ignavibacteria bacterium]
MPNYNFLNLSAYEFEELCRDLLQKELKLTFESYADGKDEGIDFQYKKKKDFIILQCKRYENYAQLKSTLKKEVKKIQKQNPKRYILSTSVKLTPQNKTEIESLLKPYILATEDIIGHKDLNNLLNIHSDIEKQHFKLWLASTSVLNKILNAKVINNSQFEKELIYNNLKLYVKNESFFDSIKILKGNRFIIISGIPGIGKTTLARMLICYYLGKGYREFINISQNISEGEQLYEEGKKQIFLYDDFLGRTSLVETNPHDTALLTFINHIKGKKNKILIFTTREYILNQATQIIEKFNSLKNENKVILDLQKYSEETRARILYNHLFFSGMDENYFNDILYNKRYLAIINHKNYSPRIIEYITKKEIYTKILDSGFFQTFINYLDDPSEIWNHAYQNDIKFISKIILAELTLLSSNGPIFIKSLQNATEVFFKRTNRIFDHFEFNKGIYELENCFIKTQKDFKGNILVEFQNPSIEDYMINNLNKDSYLLGDLIRYSIFFEQITLRFSNLYTKNYINLDKDNLDTLGKKLVKDFDLLKDVGLTLNKTTNNENYYSISESSKFSKVYYLYIRGFHNNIEIRKFIVEKLSNDIFADESSFLPLSSTFEMLNDLKKDLRVNPITLLKALYGSLIDIDDAKYFKKFETLFPKEFKHFLKTNNIKEKLEELISDENDFSDDLDEMHDLIYKINDLETTYGFDFSYEQESIIDDMKSKLDDLTDNESDLDELHYQMSKIENFDSEVKDELSYEINNLEDKISDIESDNELANENKEKKETDSFIGANTNTSPKDYKSTTLVIDEMFNSLLKK